MKDSSASCLVSAILAVGTLIVPQLNGQVSEIPPPEPEAPMNGDFSADEVETTAKVGSGSDADTVTETDTVIRDSGGSMVAEEETVKVTPAPKKRERIPVSKKDSFYETYIHDRLTVGTRMLWYSLTDTESGDEFSGSFIGSLNRTTEDQDPAPVYFYAEYALTPYFGFGLSYDQFKVVTLDSGGGDGTFDLSGPILYGFGRFENGSAFTPFAEVGVAFYSADFNAKDDWTFSDGGNTVINRFDADNSTGFVIAGGVDYQIIEHLSVNLYIRYVSVDIDVDYYFTPASNTTPSGSAKFPGDHIAYGFGIAYTF
ncbi:outer membrane beta-barrel protein [Puniceicoccus vermicola]|uniref:Outer membrane protein OmpA-like transmembrane domain-containing protein n=1 Tax=Puniceicoccus vermicola TaxID=388746 RepID=A0A7X1B1Y1_9BACT|nr:outer membrane beta-barrel protein [Puniceicoccus vermicola]MBC2604037.1 hypothetical protein [Puniceicoccus vermicola]